MPNKSMRKFTAGERFWLNLFIRSPLPYARELYHQLKVCDIEREDCQSYYYIYFHFNQPAPVIDISSHMPVCVELCQNPVFIDISKKNKKYFRKTGSIHRFEDLSPDMSDFFNINSDTEYYSVNLFFDKGVICELEIIEWNGRPIEKKPNKNLSKIYRYFDERIYKAVVKKEHLE